MSTQTKFRLGCATAVVAVFASLAFTAVPRQSQSAAAPILLLTTGNAGSSPSGPVDPSAPEELTIRSLETLSRVCAAGEIGEMWCGSYLMGVADTLTAFGSGGHEGGICGSRYGIERLRQIFTTWAEQNPQFRELDMLAGVTIAFRAVWPCS